MANSDKGATWAPGRIQRVQVCAGPGRVAVVLLLVVPGPGATVETNWVSFQSRRLVDLARRVTGCG